MTATVAGASLETDAWASMCPLCHLEREADEGIDEGCWHIVDAQHGRAVCSACLARLDPALARLIQALEQLEQRNRLFESMNQQVKH